MADFVVSARKYRPDTFKTVVGQEQITTTLKNSVRTKHLAHAYLFCGPRGVGKTTCARIFAKVINCFNPTEDYEPCNVCESCKGFNRSGSFNIHELDAASNNSVDGVRNLIDQVRIPPQLGKYNVYIIDEVHMLSSNAFNAFLKTLEEPPAHAIFILATTEKHKIIPTILSRCQLYDFNRIKINDIVEYLKYVSENENVVVEPEALNIIAQKADGAMRDALSIFDQLVSFCGNNISYEKVITNLNVLDYEYYFKITDSLVSGNIPDSLIIFDEILAKGFDSQYFITGLSSHFRNLLVSKDVQTARLLEVGNTIAEKYKVQSAKTGQEFLFKALEISNDCEINYRQSYNKRLHVELALVKLCKIIAQPSDIVIEKPSVPENKPDTQNPDIQNKGLIYHSQPDKQPSKTDKVEESVVTRDEYKSGKSTFSIKEALNKNKGVSAAQSNSNPKQSEPEAKKNNTFTEDELRTTWLKYAGNKNEFSRFNQLFTTITPQLKNDFIVVVPVINKVQEGEFRQMYDELVAFLRQNLENSLITMEISITENAGNTSKKPYTDHEKFQYFTKKNPNLMKMKEQLDLDFDRT